MDTPNILNFSVHPITNAPDMDDMPILDFMGDIPTFLTIAKNTLIEGEYLVTVEWVDTDKPAETVFMDVLIQTVTLSSLWGVILVVAEFTTVPTIPTFSPN